MANEQAAVLTGLGMKHGIWAQSSGCNRVLACLIALVFVTLLPQSVQAQGWQWPWEQDEANRAQRPSQPLPAYPSPGSGSAPTDPLRRSPICLELEQRLAAVANHGSQSRLQLPEIEKNIREAKRIVRRAEIRLDRSDCYQQFLFSRSLRQTRQCIQLDSTLRQASQQLQSLLSRRQKILDQGDRSYQDNIIRDLAANNCGNVYNREARRRNPLSNFWQDQDDGGGRISGNTFAGLPFATYRTMCVRLCDGFYFPVSFSTLPTHFERDAEVCQSRCAAPAQLYFHQNPGEAVDQMVAHQSRQPYTELKTAFRYRKEYVAGCSCKGSEYVSADKASPSSSQRKADAQPNGGSGNNVDAAGVVERGQLSPVR